MQVLELKVNVSFCNVQTRTSSDLHVVRFIMTL